MTSDKDGIKVTTKHIINREISWLSFNDRVLQEAHDPTVPLIERMRFMGIFSSNLDEFFRVRVASVNRMMALSKKEKHLLGYSPQKLLKEIKQIVVKQQAKFDKLYEEVLLRELAEQKIFIINEKQLNVTRGNYVKEYFKDKVLPTLVPVMIEKEKPFPFLKDRAIYLFVKLYTKEDPEKYKLALIEIPTEIHSRFLILPETNELKYIILLEDVIRYCLHDIFKMFNFSDYDSYTIKLTRDAELDIDLNDLSLPLVDSLTKSLKQRKKGKPVRFVYDGAMPRDLLTFIKGKLELTTDNIIAGGRYHNFRDFVAFPNVGAPNLEYIKNPPLEINNLSRANSMFAEIAKKDYLLHLPYHNFDYVIRFLREAAIDPKVVSIKITLYRLAHNSMIVNALVNAARNGKEVVVLLELKARFDEENNIYYTQKLIDEGVTVLHGFANKKVHSKMCLVTRREKNGLVHYANLSTGNYNEKTATMYCDHSMFTSDKKITNEVNKVFHFLQKDMMKGTYKHLMVAPVDMRKKLIKLIDHEIAVAKSGKHAWAILKMNSLVDHLLIRKLYEASTAGVKVKLIIRGICCLIAGQEGLSENIEAVSIVDKFLEHSRVFIFGNGGDEQVFLSSADWMVRNLDMRVEVSFPVYDRELKKELREVLELQLKDNTKARILDAEQTNTYKVAKDHICRAQVDTYNFLKNKF